MRKAVKPEDIPFGTFVRVRDNALTDRMYGKVCSEVKTSTEKNPVVEVRDIFSGGVYLVRIEDVAVVRRKPTKRKGTKE